MRNKIYVVLYVLLSYPKAPKSIFSRFWTDNRDLLSRFILNGKLLAKKNQYHTKVYGFGNYPKHVAIPGDTV